MNGWQDVKSMSKKYWLPRTPEYFLILGTHVVEGGQTYIYMHANNKLKNVPKQTKGPDSGGTRL